jgi:hypothetical protein
MTQKARAMRPDGPSLFRQAILQHLGDESVASIATVLATLLQSAGGTQLQSACEKDAQPAMDEAKRALSEILQQGAVIDEAMGDNELGKIRDFAFSNDLFTAVGVLSTLTHFGLLSRELQFSALYARFASAFALLVLYNISNMQCSSFLRSAHSHGYVPLRWVTDHDANSTLGCRICHNKFAVENRCDMCLEVACLYCLGLHRCRRLKGGMTNDVIDGGVCNSDCGAVRQGTPLEVNDVVTNTWKDWPKTLDGNLDSVTHLARTRCDHHCMLRNPKYGRVCQGYCRWFADQPHEWHVCTNCDRIEHFEVGSNSTMLHTDGHGAVYTAEEMAQWQQLLRSASDYSEISVVVKQVTDTIPSEPADGVCKKVPRGEERHGTQSGLAATCCGLVNGPESGED